MRRQFVILLLILALIVITAPSLLSQNAAPVNAPAAGANTPAKDTSPGATTPAKDTTPAKQPAPFGFMVEEGPINPDSELVSISFVKADLVNVLNFLSMAGDIPIVIDGDVKGTVTIASMKQVSLSLAYDVINAALRVRGYTMVGTLKDKLIRVMPLERAVADRSGVHVGNDIADVGMTDTLITQVIPLKYSSALKLKDDLKPLIADKQASLVAVATTNTLIVTDTEANVRRFMEVVKELDVNTSDILELKVYKCQYANAGALAESLQKIFEVTSAGPKPNQPPQPNRPPDPNNPTPSVKTDDGVLSLRGELHIGTDDRTNSLVISASHERIAMVMKLVAELDVDTTSEVHAKVFPLQYADAKLVADTLTKMFVQPQATSSGNRFFYNPYPQQPATTNNGFNGLKENMIVADVRTNSVIVTATDQNLRDFEIMIKQLDAPSVLSDITRTFQLKYAKAPDLAQVMTQLFRGSNRGGGFNFFDLFYGNGNSSSTQGDPIASLRNITVIAEPKTNTLLVTGPPQSFAMVEGIIQKLDRRTPQVFIEVAIVDVTLDNSTKFGVEWTWKNGKSPDGLHPRDSFGTNFGLTDEKFGLKYSVISDNLQVLLHALTTRSNVKVYSTPSITTADNVAARISIGQDVPFVSSSEETNGGNFRQTVDFKNVSIALNVTPHVSEASQLISLDVQQTINELIGTEPVLNAPIIANREAKTTVMVTNGQTIVIGGIIKENKEKDKKEVPFLSRIPLIGEAFKTRTNTDTKSELMVFLTPHILSDEAGINEIKDQQINKLTDPVPNLPVPDHGTAPASDPSAAPAPDQPAAK